MFQINATSNEIVELVLKRISELGFAFRPEVKKLKPNGQL